MQINSELIDRLLKIAEEALADWEDDDVLTEYQNEVYESIQRCRTDDGKLRDLRFAMDGIKSFGDKTLWAWGFTEDEIKIIRTEM